MEEKLWSTASALTATFVSFMMATPLLMALAVLLLLFVCCACCIGSAALGGVMPASTPTP